MIKCTSLSIEIIVSNENALKREADIKLKTRIRSVQTEANTTAILIWNTFFSDL